MNVDAEALKVQMWIDKLPTDPVDVETGLKAIRDDASILADQTEKFVKGRGGVPDFRSHAIVMRYIAMTAEKCRLSLQGERIACDISMVARAKKVWPAIKAAIKYIWRG